MTRASLLDHIINHFFHPDRKARTCAIVLPICVLIGAIIEKVPG